MKGRGRQVDLARRRLLRGLLGGGVVVGALGGLGVAQGYGLGVTRHTRPLPGLTAPVTVALLTDLHYGPYTGPQQVRRWVETTNALRPDLVLLGGDQFDRHTENSFGAADPGPTGALFAELGRLRAPLGVYGVWGNHDYGAFGSYGGHRPGVTRPDWQARREAVRASFAARHITILQNEGRAVRPDLYVSGVDDWWQGQPDAVAALSGAGNRASILLSHNPDILPNLPQPAGLVLSGHTHGGQVRLPLLGAISVPSDYGLKYAMGWVTGAYDTPAYVSRGLGMSGLPVRNLCEPEIALLTLVPAG